MILIRHGQSEFNVHHDLTGQDPGISDPKLTEMGQHQVAQSAAKLKAHTHPIRRVLTSPYTRALQTAQIIADTLDVPIAIEPCVHEHAYYSCDIGTTRSVLKQRWPKLIFDHIEETWWPNLGETRAQLEMRCQTFHRLVAAFTDWQHVVVVSHWGFILQLTGYSAANAELVPYNPLQQRQAKMDK